MLRKSNKKGWSSCSGSRRFYLGSEARDYLFVLKLIQKKIIELLLSISISYVKCMFISANGKDIEQSQNLSSEDCIQFVSVPNVNTTKTSKNFF